MKLRLRKSATIMSLSIVILGLFAVVGLSLASRSALASDQSGHLMTVHDRGVETVFLTEAKTISEALTGAGIDIDARDAVEPALQEELVASDYQVNIYRARPVTVVDGATRQRIVTPYQTAERIAQDVGVTLQAEDTTKLTRSTDIISDGAGLQLVIDRATPVTVDLYGKKTDLRTQAETIGAMLKEKGISLGKNGRVSPDESSRIVEGQQIRIWREGKQTITVDEIIEFTTEEVVDADQLVGYKQVTTPGVNGQRSVVYEIDIQNGVQVSRTEIASVETKPAVKQVQVVGSKAKTLTYTGGGSKTEWLAASNIPEASWGYADSIVGRESGWNPNAVNKSSGACGLAQALPCSKVGANPYDPVVSLNWMNGYVNGRYGGWEGAYNFWQKNHWY